jgi:ssDNA-binding Zn-finger/Zn-ribbon topoisomerase 1
MSALRWDKAKRRAASSLERAHAAHDRMRRVPLHLHGGDCPKCGSATVERKRRSDGKPFFGCTAYPRCNGTWSPPPIA